MSTAILTLSEDGNLQQIHEKWLSKKACPSGSSDIQSDQLPLESFWGLYFICGLVCFIALVIYFCKLLRQFAEHLPKASDGSGDGSSSSRSQRVMHFLEFIDEKEDETKKRLKRKRNDMSSTNGTEVEEESNSRNYRTKRTNVHFE